MTDYADLLPIATEAMDLADAMLRKGKPGRLTAKGDRDMATDLDYSIERALRVFLAERTPHIGFLGEEDGVTGAGRSLTWALDPIDGTVNFLHGHPMVAVSLGLLAEDQPVLGVIDAPFLGSRFSAVAGHGAFKDGRPLEASSTDRLADAIVALGDYAVGADARQKNASRFVLTRRLAETAQRVRMHGSAAIDLAFLAAGVIDAVVMLGNNPWDVAAGVIIAREAGALVLDANGSEHSRLAGATIGVTVRLRDELLAIVSEAAGRVED